MSDAEMDGVFFIFLLANYDFNVPPIGFAFDPDQDLEQKRSLRQDYRKLASKIEGSLLMTCDQSHLVLSHSVEYQGNPIALGVDELREQLETADKLFEKGLPPRQIFDHAVPL